MDDVELEDRDSTAIPPRLRRTRETRAEKDDETLQELDGRVENLLALLGKRHTFPILRLYAVEGGPWRFSELEDRLDVSPNTLSERLSELTEVGLLDRRSYDEIPPRVEYHWTDSARDLSPAVHGFYDWALEHDLEPTEGNER